jgi:SAM-dependent methyltransferase
VIHFAPEQVLRDVLASDGVTYHTADLFLEDVTFPGVDLANLPFESASYDLVVCNHVLEHLPDDAAALAHFARILTPDGVAVITVPGDFKRPATLHFTRELENGHYRDYGLDFIDRLRERFGRVDAIDLHSFDRDRNGMSRAIRMNDLAFVCRRTG